LASFTACKAAADQMNRTVKLLPSVTVRILTAIHLHRIRFSFISGFILLKALYFETVCFGIVCFEALLEISAACPSRLYIFMLIFLDIQVSALLTSGFCGISYSYYDSVNRSFAGSTAYAPARQARPRTQAMSSQETRLSNILAKSISLKTFNEWTQKARYLLCV
jgi:hypothetical protein